MSTKSHKKIIIIGGIASVIMFSFSFAIVPLYSIICRATGINTSVPVAEWKKTATAESLKLPPDLSREVSVQFMATNHMGMPWDFYPRVKSIVVHPGQNAKVYFYAKNTTDKAMTVQAIPSMTPTDALGHFHKIECFCFRQQSLNAHESKEMPLIFQVDKELPKEIRTITLSYTLFDVTPKETKKG
jgi:cytochrome c oxidase assembly protein subunit 11